ncbi:Cytochrome P450 2J2 [Desmophyllum pertusum]|uniref:Cytochrome P450 2J2 n=1 Tax=Desmophyllum pertusum TaxID=174260 RepID=A0A9X0A379_9CNID|nr:Cytochrome P450 2J2 [Desmophyllum pertusum]
MAFTDVLQVFAQWQTILLASAILLVVYVFVSYRSLKSWYGDDVPGPSRLVYMLDLFLYKEQMHLQVDSYYKKYGKVFKANVFGKIPCLMVADAEMVKDIFVKEFDCFSHRPVS